MRGSHFVPARFQRESSVRVRDQKSLISFSDRATIRRDKRRKAGELQYNCRNLTQTNMNLNEQFKQLRQSPTVAINDQVVALKAAGKQIIALQVGDPDFPTPQPILEAAFNAMQSGMTHYGSSQGLMELRKAAANKLERDNGLSYRPESEILVSQGGIHAYYLAMQAVLNPGEEVLIPDPAWATHANMAVMLRGSVMRVPARAENGFLPTFTDWEQAISPRSRVMVLNYPCNPTGAYPSRDYMERLQELAAAHNLWVVSDEVYENLYFAEKPTWAAACAGAKERTLVVQSLSKTYAMTGWRVGYLCGPARVIENALKAGQNSITCVAPFIQKAAAFALTDPGVQQSATAMRRAYARRRQMVQKMAKQAGEARLKTNLPKGAFYFFLDFRKLKLASIEICERILAETGVGLVPGVAFGSQGEGFVRMSIAASDLEIETGFRKILDWAEKEGG
jgi:aspartate/methionine/tyrosine aminotransferase